MRYLTATFKKVVKTFALLARISFMFVLISGRFPIGPHITVLFPLPNKTGFIKFITNTSGHPSGTSDDRAILDPSACRTDSPRNPPAPAECLIFKLTANLKPERCRDKSYVVETPSIITILELSWWSKMSIKPRLQSESSNWLWGLSTVSSMPLLKRVRKTERKRHHTTAAW